MFTLPIPLTSASLNFTLPLPGWSRWLRLAVVLLLLVGFGVVLSRLYRHELLIAKRKIARILLGLRLTAMGVVFLTLGTQPTLVKTSQIPVPSRVLVALDTSDSMRITDPHRTEAEKLTLASVLRVPDIDNTTRLQLAERVLSLEIGGLLKKLAEKHTVEFVRFDSSTTGLPLDEGAWKILLQSDRKLDPKTSTAQLTYTDLKQPLIRTVESSANTAQSKLITTVVLTDGRHNWGDVPTAKAAEVGSLAIPVYSLVFGPKNAPADVAVMQARAQSSTVFKGSTVPVEVIVRITSWPVGRVEVAMEIPPDEKGQKRPPVKYTIQHNGEDQTYQFTLPAKLDNTGPQSLVITATPSQPDPFPANNSRTARVNVVKERARILLVDGEARWEFHYLHTALGRDENMDVRSTVFRQPRITKATDDDLKKFGIPALTLPDADVLSGYDGVLLGDVEADQLVNKDKQFVNWDWLEKYIAEEGGTLVMMAGKRGMPLAHQQENNPVRKLLPLKTPVEVNDIEGFHLNLTADGERSWFLQLADTPAINRLRWQTLPAHYWCITGEAKPGAEVLAEQNGKPVILRQNYGFGRVLFIGLDSTWRWRFRVGDLYHHKFWGQVAQWAASDRLLPTQNATGTIRFGTREPTFRFGSPIDVIVRATEVVKKLGPNSLKGVKVFKLGGPEPKMVNVVALALSEFSPRMLLAPLKELPPGSYAVELEIPEWAEHLQGGLGPDGRVQPLRSQFEILPPENEELVELSADIPMLQSIAEATKGEVFQAEQYEQLLKKLDQQTATIEERTEYPARTSWLTLVLVVLLLGCEWSLRKWVGLV
jgi:hypothetical protein